MSNHAPVCSIRWENFHQGPVISSVSAFSPDLIIFILMILTHTHTKEELLTLKLLGETLSALMVIWQLDKRHSKVTQAISGFKHVFSRRGRGSSIFMSSNPSHSCWACYCTGRLTLAVFQCCGKHSFFTGDAWASSAMRGDTRYRTHPHASEWAHCREAEIIA